MSSQTCVYVAKQQEPETWHGEDSSDFWLDNDPEDGGLGISEWCCPHPPLGEEADNEKYCVFHTEMEVPADRQREELLDALDDAGEGPWDDRPEHRGQFVGATFGAIDLSDKTIAATHNHDIRFDHARFQAEDNDLNFEDTKFKTEGQYPVSFVRAEFIAAGTGDVQFGNATFRTGGAGSVRFTDATLTDANFRNVDFDEADLRGTELTGTDIREGNVTDVSVNSATTCRRLYEGSQFDSEHWDATARSYHDLKTVFSDHGLVNKARHKHVQERRARSFEAKAAHGWFNRKYLHSLFARSFTGYGVQVWNLVTWMLFVFLSSTAVYTYAGVAPTLVGNISFSIAAFMTGAPYTPPGVFVQLVSTSETVFGTISIVLLGYILGNRERF